MIYLFAGDDTKTKLISYEKFLQTTTKDVEVFHINRNNFDRMQIESLYSGAGLFFATCVVVFLSVLEYEDHRDFVLEKLSLMGESKNTFVFLESKLSKPIVDTFKKARAELNIFELPKEKKEKFDNFLVANAFSEKDKFHVWLYFRQAMDRGVGMEEIIGVLFWKIKNMLVTRNLGKFSESELKDLAARLSYLLPKARNTGLDAESVFEQFLLEAF